MTLSHNNLIIHAKGDIVKGQKFMKNVFFWFSLHISSVSVGIVFLVLRKPENLYCVLWHVYCGTKQRGNYAALLETGAWVWQKGEADGG